MAVLASALADRLMRKKTLTTVQARKIFTTFATMTPGFLMIAQIFCGLDRTWSVTIFTLQLFLNGAVTAGYLGNGLDIAPNYSGTIFGLANTVSSIGGYLSTFIVGTLTSKNVCITLPSIVWPSIYNLFRIFHSSMQQTYGQWQIVFGILAGSYILGSLAFLFFGKGDIQPWNNPPERDVIDKDAEEDVPLKKNNSMIKNWFQSLKKMISGIYHTRLWTWTPNIFILCLLENNMYNDLMMYAYEQVRTIIPSGLCLVLSCFNLFISLHSIFVVIVVFRRKPQYDLAILEQQLFGIDLYWSLFPPYKQSKKLTIFFK